MGEKLTQEQYLLIKIIQLKTNYIHDYTIAPNWNLRIEAAGFLSSQDKLQNYI